MTSRRSSISRIAAVAVLAMSLLAGLAPAGRTSGQTLMLVRVPVSSVADGEYLTTRFDETHNHGGGSVELLLWPGDLQRLELAGYDYVVVEDDVVGRDAELLAEPGPVVELPGPDRSTYRRWADYVAEIDALAKENPTLVRKIELPHKTLEGRSVYAVEIADRVGRVDGRPTYYIDGIHHAREWPAGEYPMIFAHHLVEGFGKDARLTRLLRDVRVLIVPVTNPDGFDYSRESLQSLNQSVSDATSIAGITNFEGYWRKNRRSLTGVTVPLAQKNPDAYGVDTNRNYSYHWGGDNGSSGFLFATTYRGSAPVSEPETRNVQDLLLSRNVVGVITNHTYGRLVLRPWGDTSAFSPDEKTLEPLGARMADAMGGYRNTQSIGLYPTNGTTVDWAYGALGAFAYTFEHGTAFHPAYDRGVGTDVDGVMEAFTIMGEAVAREQWHSVLAGYVEGPDGDPAAARLKLVKTFDTPLHESAPQDSVEERIQIRSRTAPDGTFEWHLNPSTRPQLIGKGKSETYTLIVTVNGVGTRKIKVALRRGQEVDLGVIRL